MAGGSNGRQILSKTFIDDTFEPRGRSRISGREYGYGWWMRDMAGRQAYYAWGFGGQYIVLVPEPRADGRVDICRDASAKIGATTGARSTRSSSSSSSRALGS